VVASVFFIGVGVGSASAWKRGIVPVAASLHLQNLLAVPRVKLLDASTKPQRLRVILIRPVLAQKRADDAVQFSVFKRADDAVQFSVFA